MANLKIRSKGRPKKKGATVGANKVLDHTKRMLMDRGPESVSRAEIARSMGVDQKLVRYYFPDLEVLLDEAVELGIREMDERMEYASRDRPTQSEVVENRLRALTRFIAQNPGLFRSMVERIYFGSGEKSRTRLAEITKKAYRRHEMAVGVGQAKAEFKEFDPRFLYLAVLGMAEVISTSKPLIELLFEDEDEANILDGYEDFIVSLLFDGILSD